MSAAENRVLDRECSMAEELVRLCAVDEVDEGGARRVPIPGRDDVAVFKICGEIYVTDDLCTHATASLSEDGLLDGHVIECTWHQGKYDVRTGAVMAPPCVRPLRTYTPVIQDNAVHVTAASLRAAG